LVGETRKGLKPWKLQRALMTTLFDDAGEGSGKAC
jgi:hypothetical protein